MDIKAYTTPAKLEYYSFLWSEIRLLVAALALMIGGVPPIYLIATPALLGVARSGLTVAWIISGIAAAYLLYRWFTNEQKLFGKKDTRDMVAFFVMIISGLNLGFVGLTGTNVGMSIFSGRGIFFVVAFIYIVSAIYLYRRWKASNEKIFG